MMAADQGRGFQERHQPVAAKGVLSAPGRSECDVVGCSGLDMRHDGSHRDGHQAQRPCRRCNGGEVALVAGSPPSANGEHVSRLCMEGERLTHHRSSLGRERRPPVLDHWSKPVSGRGFLPDRSRGRKPVRQISRNKIQRKETLGKASLRLHSRVLWAWPTPLLGRSVCAVS